MSCSTSVSVCVSVMVEPDLIFCIRRWFVQAKAFGNDKWTYIQEEVCDREMGDESKQSQAGFHEDDPWGWFEDVEHGVAHEQQCSTHDMDEDEKKIRQTPSYILEDTLSAQALWQMTSGQRPKQPEQERRYFENLWLANFEKSRAMFTKTDPLDSPSAPSPERSTSCGEDVLVLYKAKNSFGTGVNKSFKCKHCHKITTYMVSTGQFLGTYYASVMSVFGVLPAPII